MVDFENMTDKERKGLEKIVKARNQFLSTMGKTAIEYGLDEDLGAIMISSMLEMIEHSVVRDEDIVNFVNRFVETAEKMHKEGDLEPKSPFKNPEEARKAYREEYKNE